jgi:RNA polymerase sigma factor (sigma-70 family)
VSDDFIARIRRDPAREQGWADWYKSAYPRLYYVAFRLARGNADAARDLTQDSFARFLAYGAIDRVQSDQHALAFLIKTCRNLAINRGARAHEVSLDGAEELEAAPAPDAALDAALDLERLLQKLLPADRQLLEWARDGLSLSEIARNLGVSYTAAGVRLHRLKKQLRDACGR